MAGLMVGLTPADAARRFVSGTLPSYTFEQMLRHDDGLQLYLSGDSGTYPEGSLLLHLLDLDWTLPEQVVEAQTALVRFLRGRGEQVTPTDRYESWVVLIRQQHALRARVQPDWLDMPAAYFAVLLEECSGLDGVSLEAALRMRVAERFRYQGRPPRWLHDQPWPVNHHGPLVFVDQVDISSGPADTSYCYIFFDEQDADYLVLVQSSARSAAIGADPRAGAVVADVVRGTSAGRGTVPDGAVGTAHWETAVPLTAWLDRGRKPCLPGDSRCPVPGPVGPVPRVGAPPVPADVPAPARSAWSAHRQTAAPLLRAHRPRGTKPVLAPPSGVAATPVTPAPDAPAVRAGADEPIVAAAGGPARSGSPWAEPDPPRRSVPSDDSLDRTRVVARPAVRSTLVLGDQVVALRSTTVVLGRQPQVVDPDAQTVVIPDRAVSKTHARLDLVDDVWHITDLGSTNGVSVSTADGNVLLLWPGDPTPVHGWFALGPVEARLVSAERRGRRPSTSVGRPPRRRASLAVAR